jgi:hypothetical protein
MRNTVVLPTSHPRIGLPFHFIIYTFFMYLYHSISIDLELSRSCNSTHCKAYSYNPRSHNLLSQLIYYLILKAFLISATTFASILSFFILLNEYTIKPNV